MVERFISETTGGYNCEISPSQIKTLEQMGYREATFVIEYNNNDGHYYEMAHLWTKSFRRGETFDEFCHRVAREFLDWACLVLG